MEKRFQRPLCDYSGAEDLKYRDKYQQDSKSIPKIAISSSKVDGDFNYIVDGLNTLDEDIKSVVYSGIATSAIESKHIADGSIISDKIANDSVGGEKIKQSSITSDKIVDLSVTSSKIANNSITEDKMADLSIGTSSVIDGSITKDKLAEDVIMDSIPVGTIAQFSVDVMPVGWLECNGATISKDTYPKLVRFLTGSDTEISAVLPIIEAITEEKDGNSVVIAKSAIKAFSDSPELANLDIAGLTQDVAKNTADIASNIKEIDKKQDKYFEPVAEVYFDALGNIKKQRNISSVSKIGTGQYRVYFSDELKDKKIYGFANTNCFRVISVQSRNMPGNYADLASLCVSNDRYYDTDIYMRFFDMEV